MLSRKEFIYYSGLEFQERSNSIKFQSTYLFKIFYVIPDLSLGTHFFADLVESNMIYVALDPKPQTPDNDINRAKFLEFPNILTALLPQAAEFTKVIHVIDGSKCGMRVYSDPLNQKFVLYLA